MPSLEQFLASENTTREFSKFFRNPVDSNEDLRWIKILAESVNPGVHGWLNTPFGDTALMVYNAPLFGLENWIPDAKPIRINVLIKNPFQTIRNDDDLQTRNGLTIVNGFVFITTVDAKKVSVIRPTQQIYQQVLVEEIERVFPNFQANQYSDWEDAQHY
jgi:hypothetical protein